MADAASLNSLEPAAKPRGGSSIVVVVVLALVAAAALYYWHQQQAPAAEEAKRPPSPVVHPPHADDAPLTPAQQFELRRCRLRGLSSRGDCKVDSDGKVRLYCRRERFGKDCGVKCDASPRSLGVYKAGFEAGSGAPATCACPTTSHFKKMDAATGGCLLHNPCVNDWYGDRCDRKKGAPCTGRLSGQIGERCQFTADHCTRGGDTKATFNEATQRCDCSTGWKGSTCEKPPANLAKNASGDWVDWRATWTKVRAGTSATFTSGTHQSVNALAAIDQDASVTMCKLLDQSASGTTGCNTQKSLCNAFLVPTSPRCMLERHVTGQMGIGNAGNGIFPWLSKVDYPSGSTLAVHQGLSCGSGSSELQKTPCLSSSCTWTASNQNEDYAMQFGLAPGHYLECGQTLYRGAPTSTAVLPGGRADTAPNTGTEV